MVKKKKLWIFAGEASGDMYGGKILELIKKSHPQLEVYGMGGQKMRAIYPELKDSTKLGVIGFIEVLKKLPFFYFLFKSFTWRAWRKKYCPDAVLMIDYPGFNFPLAKKLKKKGVKILWFISPQVWAWKAERIPSIVDTVDKMFTLLPFEPKVYEKTSLDVEFVGHPLLEILPIHEKKARDKRQVLLLPGSRIREIQDILPEMCRTAQLLLKKYPDLKFSIPIAREFLRPNIVKILIRENLEVELVEQSKIHHLMETSYFSLAASGTVVLECALMGLPTAVLYRVHPRFAKHVAKSYLLDYYALPNILLNKEICPEFVQENLVVDNIFEYSMSLFDEKKYAQVQEELFSLRTLLQTDSSCFEGIHQYICKMYE